MSYYPRTPLRVYGSFNEADVLTSSSEVSKAAGEEPDEVVDLSHLVAKAGDTMGGLLTLLSGARFGDDSFQSTALSSTMIFKLAKILLRGGEIELNKLYFSTEGGVSVQNYSFSDSLRDQVIASTAYATSNTASQSATNSLQNGNISANTSSIGDHNVTLVNHETRLTTAEGSVASLNGAFELITTADMYTQKRLNFRNSSGTSLAYVGLVGSTYYISSNVGAGTDSNIIIHPGTGYCVFAGENNYIGGQNSKPGRLIMRSSTTGTPGSIQYQDGTQTNAFTPALKTQIETSASKHTTNDLVIADLYTRVNTNTGDIGVLNSATKLSIYFLKTGSSGWSLVSRNSAYSYGTVYSGVYLRDILGLTEMEPYATGGQLWNAGPMRIQINFAVSHLTNKSAMKRMKTRIRHYTDAVLKNDTLYSGIDYKNEIDLNNIINYTGQHIIDIKNGDGLHLETDLWISSEVSGTFGMEYSISINQL